MGIAVVGTGLLDGPDEPPAGLPVDLSRLRRMDRFGRYGFLAGSLALHDAGVAPGESPDPRAGVVIGTAFGCRDSITEHDHLVRTAARVEDLRPAVFAQTVHNTVNGELAIAWRLGGLSETVVSGPAASLEAILLAARRIEDTAADLVVAGGAEGLPDEMLLAPGSAVRNSAAALVLSRGVTRPPLAYLVSGLQVFRSERRLSDWIASLDLPGLEVLEAAPERLGASGAVAAVDAVRALASGAARAIVVTSRVHGGGAVGALFQSSQ